MPELQIINTSVITVKSTTRDNYGNLVVTPTEGGDVKISQKRESLFDVFQEGRAVKLYWAEYMHKKYIARAELFDGKPPTEKQTEPITAGVETQKEATETKQTTTPIVGQEIGLWVKEIGEMIRCDGIPDNAEGKAMKLWYWLQMKRVTGITITKKEG